MRIAFFATCPANTYSGGRYHALIAAYCLARRGHKVWFITDNTPIFNDDLAVLSPANPVNILISSDFDVDSLVRFDAVFVAPQLTTRRPLYSKAIELARRSSAALIFFCFETPNWFNSMVTTPRSESGWAEWHMLTSAGALVLCSAEESRGHAEKYFTDNPPETIFDVWQPAINTAARDAAVGDRSRRRILLFARPSDEHKGANTIHRLLEPSLSKYLYTIVIGNGRKSEEFIKRTSDLAHSRGIQVEFLFGLSDVEKFEIIKSSAVTVFPSSFEGYGYPPIEALSCNTPCICYDLPVLRENCGDLAHYVPVGDVDALRDALVDMLRFAEQPKEVLTTSKIQFLTDIDVRADELERVVNNYITHRQAVRSSSRSQTHVLSASKPGFISICGERLLHFILTSKKPISGIVFKDDEFDCSSISPLFWQDGSWHHQVFARVKPSYLPARFIGLVFAASFFNGGKAEVHIAFDANLQSPPIIATPVMAGLTRARRLCNRISIDAWALATVEYDSAVWVSRTATGLVVSPGVSGLPNSDYRRINNYPKAVDCGLHFRIPEGDLENEQHAFVLYRNGSAVAVAEVDGKRLSDWVEDADTELTSAVNQPGTLGFLPIGDATQPKLFRSQAEKDDRGIDVSLWTNIFDNPTEIHVRAIEPTLQAPNYALLSTFPVNSIRDDVQKNYEFPHGNLGFSLYIPRTDSSPANYAIALIANGEEIDQIPRLNLRSIDEIGVPVIQCRTFHPGVAEGSRQPIVSVVGARPSGSIDIPLRASKVPKLGISKCVLDGSSNSAIVEGWILSKDSITFELVNIETHEVYVSNSSRTARKDVATKYGITDFEDYGFSIKMPVPNGTIPPLKVRFVAKEGFFARECPPFELVNIKEFKMLDHQYDREWNLIWMRGSFVQPGIKLRSIELVQNNKAIAVGVTNVKQNRLDEPLSGWKFEAVLSEQFDSRSSFEIIGHTTTELPCRIIGRLKNGISEPTRVEKIQEALFRFGLHGALEAFLPECRADPRPTVLLVIHNLDAIDRPDKVRALVGLEAELAVRGLRLIILHHCKNSIPAKLSEINFFDEALDALSMATAREDLAFRISAEKKELFYLKLRGFLSTVNRTPPAMEACQTQIDEEIRKVDFVISHIQPRAVVLWHQWNSLTEIASHIAELRSIPAAYLHEGMLPKTLTFDRAMMAEASCVGSLMGEKDEDADEWLSRADAAIQAIRESRLDRKPVSLLSIGAEIRHRADEIGAKVVFYAGINDWHSGNLPRDEKALLHSPFYEDTYHGLQALVALAEENNWIILFKPHPNLYPRPANYGPRVAVVRESNPIHCVLSSDVTVTILSSLSYIARAHGKPVVLLGRNTLSGTGSVYEIGSPNELNEVMNAALADTKNEQKDLRFRLHIAALLKDYLYTYDAEDTLATLGHDILAQRILELVHSDQVEDVTSIEEQANVVVMHASPGRAI